MKVTLKGKLNNTKFNREEKVMGYKNKNDCPSGKGPNWQTLLVSGLVAVMMVFGGAGVFANEYGGGAAGSINYYQQELGKSGIGSGKITETGILNYTYPMGESGIAYSSSSAGWSVTGSSVISRDTRHGVPSYDYTKDTFILNGQKLIYETGTSYPRIYHTERESYLRIQYYNYTSPSSSYWLVTGKDGTKMYYGNTGDSRIEAVRDEGGIRCWALAKVESVKNAGIVEYYYDEDTTNGDYYLEKVVSGMDGATKYKATILYYIADSYPRISYREGAKVKVDKKLKSVLVKMETDSSGVGGSKLKAFKVSWTLSDAKKSLVSEIKEYGDNVVIDGSGNITGGIFLPPTTFTYKTMNKGFTSSWDDWGYPDGCSLRHALIDPIYDASETTYDMLDIDGDGLPDRVYKWGNDNLQVIKNLGDSLSSTWDDWGAIDDGYSLRRINTYSDSETLIDLLDMDGDGLPDRVYKSDTYSFRVKKNLGSGFSGSWDDWGFTDGYALRHENTESDRNETWYDLLDMDGDGLPDRVKKISGYFILYVKKNLGSEFAGSWDNWVLSSYDSYALRHVYINASENEEETWYDLIDMNGDGLPDRVKKISGNNLYIMLNTGSGFSSSWQNWGCPDGYSLRRYKDNETWIDLIDINGDGLPDRVKKEYLVGMWVKLNTGSGFSSSWDNWGFTDDYPLRGLFIDETTFDTWYDLLDMNGDGLPDRVRKLFGSGHFYVKTNKAKACNLLVEIQNNLGGKTTYTYEPVNKSENPDMKMSMWLVDTVTQDDGLGKSYTTSYDFSDGYYDTEDREFRGFKTVVTTDQAGNKAETWYHQDDVKKGLVKKTMARDSGGSIYDYVYNHYTDYAATSPTHYGYGVSGVHTPLLTQVDSYAVDGSTSTDSGIKPGGTTWKRMKVTITYHDYGDPLVIENFGEVDSSGSDIGYDKTKTTFQYALDTGYWVVVPWHKTVEGTNSESSSYFTQAEEKYYYDNGLNLGSWLTEGSVDQGRLKCVGVWKDVSNSIYTNRFGYDSYGNVIKTQDANGNITETVFDTQYRTFPVKTILPTVTACTFSSYNYYDDYSYTGTDVSTISNNITLGRLVMARDINDQFTKTYYDELGRVSDIRKPLDESGDPTVHYDYHFYTSSSDPTYVKETVKDGTVGGLETYTYADGLGRTVQTKTEGLGNETAKWITVDSWYYYDSVNHYAIAEESVSYFSSGDYSFDRNGTPTGGRTKIVSYLSSSLGKVSWVEAPDGTDTYTYSQRFVTTSRDARNYGGIFTVNGLGQVAETKVYSGTYPFDTLYRTDKMYYNTGTGQVVKIIEDDGGKDVTKTVSYDRLGRMTSSTDPDKGTWYYYYDSYDGYTSTGNLIAQKDAKDQVIKFEYDELNRVTRKNYPGSGNYSVWMYDEDPADLAMTWGYNKGRVTTTYRYTNGTWHGWRCYGYDELGRTHQITFWAENGGPWNQKTHYTYDSMDRIDTITYPDGEVVKNTYNTGGNLEKLGTTSLDNKYVRDIDYDAIAKVVYNEYGNNTYNDYTYYGSSDNYRLNNITVTDTELTTLMDYTYFYDDVGNITVINALNTNYDQAFSYDYLNRLLEQYDTNYIGGTTSYTYNKIDNILSKNGVTYLYEGVGPHQVTSTSDEKSYSYDANGNMLGVISGGESILLSENFSSGLPGDWSVTQDGTGNTWAYDGSDQRLEIRYSSPSNTEDSKLITKSIDCSGSVNTTLSFYEVWRGGYGSYWSDGYIYVSTDGGTNWTELAHLHHCPPEAPDETVSGTQTIDISSYVDGESNVKIAWRYHGCYDWYWYIDDVSVTSSGVVAYGYDYDNRLITASGDVGPDTYYYDHEGNRVKKNETIPGDFNENDWICNKGFPNGDYSWDVVDGNYVVTSDFGVVTSAITGDSNWTDYSVEADIMATGVSAQRVELIGRVSGDTPLSNISAYGLCFYYHESFLNQMSLNYISPSGESTIASASLGFSLEPNTFYHVKMVFNGSNIKCYVNDVLKINVDHSTLTQGKVGFYTWNYGLTCKFDNIKVKDSGENELFSCTFTEQHTKTTYHINQYYEVENGTAIKYYYANGQKVARDKSGTLTFYHTDHLNGSARITNSSGTEVKRLGYMPYGSDAYESGTGEDPKYRFTGKEKDATGLYYYGARYYDPELARFITVDEAGDDYCYCRNNPLKYIDPTGDSPLSFAAAVFIPTGLIIKGTGRLSEWIHADIGRQQTFCDIMNLLTPSGMKLVPDPNPSTPEDIAAMQSMDTLADRMIDIGLIAGSFGFSSWIGPASRSAGVGIAAKYGLSKTAGQYIGTSIAGGVNSAFLSAVSQWIIHGEVDPQKLGVDWALGVITGPPGKYVGDLAKGPTINYLKQKFPYITNLETGNKAEQFLYRRIISGINYAYNSFLIQPPTYYARSYFLGEKFPLDKAWSSYWSSRGILFPVYMLGFHDETRTRPLGQWFGKFIKSFINEFVVREED